MEKLTLLEQESLKILKQLQYYCDSAELRDIEVKKETHEESPDLYNGDIRLLNLSRLKERNFLSISDTVVDFSILNKPINLTDVEKYLQKNGVDFHLAVDFINDDPTISRTSDSLYDDYVEIAIINGGSTREINTKITELINKLESVEARPKNICITYNMNIGCFTINKKDKVVVEGKQKDVSDYLVNVGKNIKASWDEIYETFKDYVDEDSVNKAMTEAHKRSIRTAVNEINKHTEKYLEPDKDLIDYKDNEYWLQYEVDKGR